MKSIAGLLSVISFQACALTLTTEEYPPFNFSKDGGRTIAGQSTDLMREVVKRTGAQTTIVLYPWKRAYLMAQENQDTCVYSTTRTEVREKLFKWVGPLVAATWVLYAKADSPIVIKTLDEAKKYSVGGYQGDAKAAYLKEQGFIIDEAINEEQTAKKLETGRIDIWVGNAGVVEWIANSMGIKIKPILTFKEVEMYAACNLSMPDTEIGKMNEALRAIKADGTYDKIIKRYR